MEHSDQYCWLGFWDLYGHLPAVPFGTASDGNDYELCSTDPKIRFVVGIGGLVHQWEEEI
jgi:hypothetical protein